ncbi:Pimeloyl-ACP methyl ester carboxylesterase [Streptomyces sp. KS_5]|nr:Pimeloyl-ACP methyl ester carboxylesterase [Streptomyces sp. KS_5]
MRTRVRAADGRHLLVERVGDPMGMPVFLLHGTPGSRLGPRPRSMFLYHLRMQVITYDRPGYGGSHRQPGRRVVDAVADVVAIADTLGLDRFAVVGRSGGAPHALACAALLPDRVTRAATLVTLAPPNADGLDWFQGMAASNVTEYTYTSTDPESVTARLIPRAEQIRNDPKRLLDDLRRELTDSDRLVVSDAGVRGMLQRNYEEALRTSAWGWVDDTLAFCSPWGFEPEQITKPVLLWHGEKDVFSPAGHSRWLAGRIPGATAVLEPAATHFDAVPQVLTWLVRSDDPGWPTRSEPRATSSESGSTRPPFMTETTPRESAGATGQHPSAGASPPGAVPPSVFHVPDREPHRLVAELAEQAPPGRTLPLQVQIVCGAGRGVVLPSLALPPEGARLTVTVHAPGLVALDDLQQEVTVLPGKNSSVLRFGLRTDVPGTHVVTVRAFRGASCLGEVRCPITVEPGSVTHDGPQRHAPLGSLAQEPGETTLLIDRDETTGTYSFRLIGQTCHEAQSFQFRGQDARQAREQLYSELRRMAQHANGQDGDQSAALRYRRLQNLGVQLWSSAVPPAVQRQFWDQATAITSLTVIGEHNVLPWELLYPVNGDNEAGGFLSEWMQLVRRIYGQTPVHHLTLDHAAFVVPPGSPPEAADEVERIRACLGTDTDGLTSLSTHRELTELIDLGQTGLIHFACHNTFTASGAHMSMADTAFDPIDLSTAAESRSLRDGQPLVFLNACRSAGEIDWFNTSLGWAPQFLRAGAAAFIGTLWPVRSDSALAFAEAFYQQLVTGGQTLGEASLNARRAISENSGDPTRLAYAVYGNPAARHHP